MDSTKTTYATFLFEWTVKSTSYQIQYRKAFNTNEIDEIYCSIINAKGNEIKFSELGILLGFNLQDLAEIDIFKIYLKGLTEYNLIAVNEKEQKIQLTEFGQEAIQSKLKYKYYFATTELFDNQTATGETFDFHFKNVFDIENRLSHGKEFKEQMLDNPELKQKLQFQLFGHDIYKGEIVVLYESEPRISYKTISLQTEISAFDNSLELSIFKSGANKPEVLFLIGLPENTASKSKLLRQGMYHHILSVKTSITKQDIETYIDLWNWRELAGNPKLDWYDNTIFELFRKNGDGGIWSIISEKAPIESIKSIIEKYAEYWNWTTLTERFDDEYIKEKIETFDWDFEELSYKEVQLTTSLLSNSNLKEKGWDWNYLSQNLPDKFIEEHIEDFPWDFYVITESKNEVFKNTFIKYRDQLETLISKNWNWKFISEEINLNFLHKNISELAGKLNWHTVLNRLFINEELTAKCLNDESFKTLLKQHVPENFVVARQKYIWTPNLIDFFENQNLIHWETQKYINGFDTNENVEWSKPIFQKYHNRIIAENGFFNVSKQISDYSLINEFPDFAWNWEGISHNKKLITNSTFIEKAFLGELSYSNNLLWNEILLQSTFDVSFWNKKLEAFYNTTESEKQAEFWKSLTRKEKSEYIFANKHFPWDWSFITENSSEETILDSYEDYELFEKWDWKIATRKIDQETILELPENFAQHLDWKYLINEVFTVENELAIDKQLPKIAACLTVVESEKRKEYWKDITCKIPFETLFPIVQATIHLDVFEWDWVYISNHNHFPTDFRTLNGFKEKINWDIFSSSKAILKKFTYKKEEWTYQEYFKYVLKYLKSYRPNWNWNTLSRISDLHNNRDIVRIFQDNWDWNYLSEFGGFLSPKKRDKDDYLLSLIPGYSLIEFAFLSKRKDIKIDCSLILAYKDNDWNWQVLSANERAEISNELIFELKHKNWNWGALSKRKNTEFNNETIIKLFDKEWNYSYLSENPNLKFNADFIEKSKEKPWNWNLVSRHKSFIPSVEILTLTQNYDLDWEYISQHSSLNPTKELLAKFETKWNWHSITENSKIHFNDINFLERFAMKWNWRFICKSGKLHLNNEVLNKFKVHLDWNLISSNTNVHFTKEIIQEFKQFWNWSNLKANKRVEELLGTYVTDQINKNATLNFIDKIEQQWSEWKGSIYHFSHIDNAVEIIKNRKIQSRNKANIKGDAAGNVVHRRGDAHNYARFYFRPQTPTQFYNEFLGKNTTDGYETHGTWVSWYEKARGLGFPKCPIPIFFRFSIKGVLFKYENKCCVSNGNMQADSTQFNSIEKMLDKFNFDYLYSNMSYDKEHNKKYMNYSQQEFLVKDELSFNDLFDFEIICPSEADRTLLKNLLGNEHKDILSKIVLDKRYYNNQNPRVRIEEEDSELHISTNFRGEGYFVLNGTSDIKEMEILVGDVSKTSKDKIIFKSNISLGNVKQNIQLNFIDESNRSWFVYANKQISLSQNMEHSVWDEIIEINFLLNTKLEKNKLISLLDEQNYNPYSLFEMAFGVKYDFQNIPIDKDKIKLFSCSNIKLANLQPLYSFNKLQAVWAYDIMEDFQKYQNERKQLEKENLVAVFGDMDEDAILIDGNENFHLYFNLRLIFDHYNEVYSNVSLIKILCKCEELESYYNKRIRHYSLNTHTTLVINQYLSCFQSSNELIKSISSFSDDKWFLLFLAFHDIGKSKAFEDGNKDNQYFHSQLILKKFWSKLPATSNKDLLIALSLLNSDCIGEYFQAKLSLHETKIRIIELADSCNMNVFDFFKIYMIYYQCDIASYTADAGGIKFLDHLFEYDKGKKLFDEDEGLLKMAPKYWAMYKQLKNEIENGN